MFVYNVMRKMMSLLPRRKRVYSLMLILLSFILFNITFLHLRTKDSDSWLARKEYDLHNGLVRVTNYGQVLAMDKHHYTDENIKFVIDGFSDNTIGRPQIGKILRQDGDTDTVVISVTSEANGWHSDTRIKTHATLGTIQVVDVKEKRFEKEKMGQLDRSMEMKEQKSSNKRMDQSNYRNKECQGYEERVTETAEQRSNVCPHWSLYTHQLDDVPYGTCRPHRPADAGCRFAQRLYSLDPNLSECRQKGDGNICDIEMQDGNESSISFRVVCNRTLCAESRKNKKNFIVYSLHPEKGEMRPKMRFVTFEQFEKGLVDIIEETVANKFHFLLLKCRTQDGKMASQLMTIDPRITIEEAESMRSEGVLNVNILLIDSVARSHFYRSLPESIKTFQNWARNPQTAPAAVFDFELFQAIEGHTAENTHALFTGRPMPPHKPDEYEPVEMEVMFGHFKEAGYQTMWQEDLCYKGGWGLMTDLKAYDWKSLQRKLENTFIDHTGITHSSCTVLRSNGVDSPFFGPVGDQLCYNGRFQHTYFLRSVVNTVEAISESKYAKPLLSYMALSVGHDDRGRRIQTLDHDLVQYITDIARDSNTLTIILADHGNTYTEYTATILEGRFEMFHPHLFLIVPNKAAKLLGERAMAALRVNQRRIVTMYDLHHTVMSLARPALTGVVKPVDLFAPISSNRTCDDINLLVPNLCVCDGWDSPTSNDTLKLAWVEFAVGELNSLLQDKYAKSFEGSRTVQPLRLSCERIRPIRFENIRERNSKADGSLITSFDIVVHAGNVVAQTEDIFHVEVKSHELPEQVSLDMKLLNYDRLTMFGKYKQCAEEEAPLKLCVCSKPDGLGQTPTVNNEPWLKGTAFFGVTAKFKRIDSNLCIFLARRNYENGMAVAYEIVNVCAKKKYSIAIDVSDMANVKLSREVPFVIEVFPLSVRFALSLRRSVEYFQQTHNITAIVLTGDGGV